MHQQLTTLFVYHLLLAGRLPTLWTEQHQQQYLDQMWLMLFWITYNFDLVERFLTLLIRAL